MRRRLTVNVERDGRFATFGRIGLVNGHAPQRLEVIRLVKCISQCRDGHPSLDFAHIGRVCLIVTAFGQFLAAEEPFNVGSWITSTTKTTDSRLTAGRQSQIGSRRHGTEIHFQLRRAWGH